MTQEEGIKRIYDLISKYDLEMPYSESPERNRLKLAQDIWQLINAHVAEVIGEDTGTLSPGGNEIPGLKEMNWLRQDQRERAGLTEKKQEQ